jgi:tryptophan synthase beta chain
VDASTKTYVGEGPDSAGMFGRFGGAYMPETLMPALYELQRVFAQASADPLFWEEYHRILADYVGRPSPLTLAENLTAELGGARIWLKREDLNHTGAHKINNCTGQILLARRMGKRRVIAETGAGQHGVATATMCALFRMECVIYMGAEDMARQAPNVARMHMLGAEVRAVHSGTATLKDAMNEALRDWITNVDTTYYLLGTGAGPHPYPRLVRDFQRIIGIEAREQILRKAGRLPTALVACVGGGSNAIGLFHPFLADAGVRCFGVEAGGLGIASGQHAASLEAGRPGVLHGNLTYLLQDEDGQVSNAYSVSAGLDYPGVGPEHALLHESGRVRYVAISDAEAIAAYYWVTRREGILPALESAHALAYVRHLAPTMRAEEEIVVCLSGRGDKDMDSVLKYQEEQA